MPRTQPRVRPVAHDALQVLGQQIKQARLRRNWTATDTAARLGISPVTYRGIEQGRPTVAIGNVFNACAILGVPLFGVEDPVELTRLRRAGERDLALLRRRTSRRRDISLPGYGKKGTTTGIASKDFRVSTDTEAVGAHRA